MKTVLRIVEVACLLWLASLSTKAADVQVDISGQTTVPGIHSAIQDAIDAADIGDVITVVNLGSSAPFNATAALTLDIPAGIKVIWDLEYVSSSSFTTGLLNITGNGAFEVAPDGSLVRTGANETLTVSGASTSITVYGTVAANTARAIHLTGSSSTVTVDGGTVSNNSTTNIQAAIYVENTGNNGLNVIVKGNGKVLANGNVAGSYAIMTYGDVQIDDNAEVKSQGGGVAIDALGTSSTVTVNGGTVSTTGGPNTTAIGGSAISCHYKIVVNDGLVSATTGKAVHITEASGEVEINGGTVMATTGYAIRIDYATSTITVNDGFVFAYGTGVTGTTPATDFVTNRAPVVTNGMVVAWDNTIPDPYFALSMTAIAKSPAGSAVWIDNGTGGGIIYSNGANNGFFFLGVQVITPTIDANGILYVDHTRSGNGSSWGQAYPNLADPLLYAARQREILGNPANLITQIRVADGTYYPLHNAADITTTDPRDNAFVLVAGVKIYGGFVPNNLTSPTDLPAFGTAGRNGTTILSGDIDKGGTIANNAYHIVISVGSLANPIDANTLLDGLRITGGNADGSGSSITVKGSTIDNDKGGGMVNIDSSPSLFNVSMIGNSASNSGLGGGMYNMSSSPILTNVILSGNSAGANGGGMYNDASSPVFTNVTVSGNSAGTNGGGIYNTNSSSVIINNSILWGNTAGAGDNVFNNGSVPLYSYSLVEGSGGSSSWVASFGTDNSNNIDASASPFVNWQDPSSVTMPTIAGNYRLNPDAPAIEAGDNGLYLSIRGISDFTGETDLEGNMRLLGDYIDMGAYETTVYKVTLISETGTVVSGAGYYAAGQTVTIDIDPGTDPPGHPFWRWTSPDVTIDFPLNRTASFVMPANDVTVIAEFVDLFVVIVSSTGTGATGDGYYHEDDIVTIFAGDPPDGMEFASWTASSEVTFADASRATTTFTMLDTNVTVTAKFCIEGDKKKFEEALRIFEENEWTVVEQNIFTEERLKNLLINQINNVIDTAGITATYSDIMISNIILPAVNAKGSFEFTVTLTKCAYIQTLSQTCVIGYTPYPPIIRLITIDAATNGRIESDREYASTHETVTLTILPETGYQLDKISAFHTAYDTIPVLLAGEGNVRTFRMPPHPVTVTATFILGKSVHAPQTNNGMKTYVQDGVLYVSGVAQGASVRVYNILGALVAAPSNSPQGEEFVLPLPGRGIYIITDGYQTIKVNN